MVYRMRGGERAEKCACGVRFFFSAVVEARARAGEFPPAFTIAARASRHLSPLAFGLRAARLNQRTLRVGAAGWSQKAHMGTKKNRTWRTPQQKSNNPHGDRSDSHGVLGRSTWVPTRRFLCVLPLGEASHDA